MVVCNDGDNPWVDIKVSADVSEPSGGPTVRRSDEATDYESGTQVHIDATFAQHFPLCKGLAGVGLSAYCYQQVSDDSGSGATLGDFKARANGAGPVFSFTRKAIQKPHSQASACKTPTQEQRYCGVSIS